MKRDSQTRFLGGYFSETLYDAVSHRAEQLGLSRNSYLEMILEQALAEEAESEADAEVEWWEEEVTEFHELYALFAGPLAEEINDLIIAIGDGQEDVSPAGISSFFQLLSYLAESAVAMPLERADPYYYYRDSIPEALLRPVYILLNRTAGSVDDPADREAVLTELARQSQLLALGEPEHFAELAFTAEEWVQLQRYLADQKRHRTDELTTYLRRRLGDDLVEAGTGFLFPRDPGWLELGQKWREH